MNSWVIYVNGRALKNYEMGKEHGTWGIKKLKKNSEFQSIMAGDKITFIFNLTTPKNLFPEPAPGFPRVKNDEYTRFEGVAEEIAYGVITSDYYSSSQQLWNDETYEHRFNFKIEYVEPDALFTADFRGHDLVKKALLSFHGKGDVAALENITLYNSQPISIIQPELVAKEGATKYRITKHIERNSNLAKLKKSRFRAQHGKVFCEVCNFSFSDVYGDENDYIECHHKNQLANSGETETTLSDLILLCANCHRIVHNKTINNKNGCMDIEDLKTLINNKIAAPK
ncbi:hypothetical protein CKF43_12845 [Pantoea graminicola]|uniref:HNH endonuclease n=1 Tax=unclassified Pantoea TaxID=2630326 RepID=UPI000DAA533B|nr:HNH endonuclease [Pantoea sp. ARC607]PZL93638.1 hypothetical protein CKF43_12845 [Pantoea sp. ARC607]